MTASVHAAGSVYYKNNGDGTITIYPVPSQFNGPIYGDEYGKKESQRVLDKASTVKLYDASDSEINKISALMSSEPASYGIQSILNQIQIQMMIIVQIVLQ